MPIELPPLPSWPVRVLPHEPAHGFFQRLAAENSQISTRAFAEFLGLNGRDPRPDELLEFSLQFPTRHSDELRAATPIGKGRLVRLFGQTLRPGFDHSISPQRVCPACLREERYYRSWFDIRAIARCPHHGCFLVSCGADQSDQLQWSSTVVGVTPGGVDLAACFEPAAGHPPEWERYIFGRLGLGPPVDLPTLDQRPLHEVIEAATILGRISFEGTAAEARGRHAGRTLLSPLGFQFLKVAPDGLRELLVRYIKEAPQRPGARSALHRTRMLLRAAHTNPLTRLALEALGQARDKPKPRSVERPRGRVVVLPPDHFTMAEAAQRLGLSRPHTRQLALRIGVVSPVATRGHYYCLSERDVQAIGDALSASIEAAVAARQCGLETEAFNTLVRSGHIVPLVRMGTNARSGARFSAREVSAKLEEWRRNAVRTDGHGLPFTEYCAKTYTPPARLAVEILSGRRRIVAWDEQERGFLGCRVLNVPPLRVRKAHRCNGVSYSEAAGILSVSSSKLCLLVRAGLLRELPATGEARRGICPASLRAFQSTYASPQTYADLLGVEPAEIRRRLQIAGVERLRPGELPKLLLVSQADVVARLGGEWSLEAASGEPATLWQAFREHMKERASANRLFGGVGLCALIRSGTSYISAEVSISPVEHTVVLRHRASRDESPAQFDRAITSLDLMKAAWPEAQIECDRNIGYVELKECFPISAAFDEAEARALAAKIDDRVTALRFHLRPTNHRVRRRQTPKGDNPPHGRSVPARPEL